MKLSPVVYDDELKIKDALQIYFAKYHFKDGGYKDTWFKIKVGPLFIPLPNIKSRVDAVKIHDIHHLVTEYAATLKGEAEIGAWEIGSGCGRYYVAWLLNSGSFFYGLIFFPKAVYDAFAKGRNARTNLYHNTFYDETLLNKTVGDLRQRIGIRGKNKISSGFSFGLFSVLILGSAALFFWLVFTIGRLIIS
jgi:hypothetical protein